MKITGKKIGTTGPLLNGYSITFQDFCQREENEIHLIKNPETARPSELRVLIAENGATFPIMRTGKEGVICAAFYIWHGREWREVNLVDLCEKIWKQTKPGYSTIETQPAGIDTSKWKPICSDPYAMRKGMM